MYIPATISEDLAGKIESVRVWVSTDEGKTWQMSGNISPVQRSFLYTAPGDGVYWFAVQAVFRDGTVDPAFRDGPEYPHLRVRVQTDESNVTSSKKPMSGKSADKDVEVYRARVAELEKRLNELEKRKVERERTLEGLRSRIDALDKRLAELERADTKERD
jgi:hypothetical protein